MSTSKKAFDTVSHSILLVKLKNSVLLFFELITYLNNCLQCVNINSVLSDFLPILSGVP